MRDVNLDGVILVADGEETQDCGMDVTFLQELEDESPCHVCPRILATCILGISSR